MDPSMGILRACHASGNSKKELRFPISNPQWTVYRRGSSFLLVHTNLESTQGQWAPGQEAKERVGSHSQSWAESETANDIILHGLVRQRNDTILPHKNPAAEEDGMARAQSDRFD